MKSILNSIEITKIKNHLIFGMTSYADTGKYIGIIWGVMAFINSKLQLSAEPRFSGSVLDAFGENEFDIYPLKLLIPTIRFISKKEVRMLIRGVRDAR